MCVFPIFKSSYDMRSAWETKSSIHRYTCYPLFHQSCSSAGSELEPRFKPVLCLSTPKAPAPNQEKWFVRKLHQNIAGLEGRTACVRGWGQGYRDQLWTAIFEIAAKREHVWFTMFGCWCRFAKPWTSVATQRPPLLIVCLGLFGMDRCCTDRPVWGIGVLRERLESKLLFMVLDRSRGALVCCLSIDWSVCRLMASRHLERACCSALVNQNTKRIVT